MTYKVYIQSLKGIPTDDWGFAAYLGFSKRGTKIIFFDNIDKVPVSPLNIVVSCIDDTIEYFSRLNISLPKPLNIPDELKPYAGRNTAVMSLKSFVEDSTLPVFVKPMDKAHQFPAGVITKQTSRKLFFNDLPDDTQVFTSEVIDIRSEYRGFVIDGKLEALSHYLGDFRWYPETWMIEQAIESYTSAPRGYSIDFGVTANGSTVLIECNDGWSLGSYGCDPVIYTRLLVARWLELTSVK